MKGARRFLTFLLPVVGACLLSGCADRETVDGTVIFRMPVWTWLTAACVGLGFAVAAIRATSQGWRYWIITGLCWFLFVPGLYGDRVILTRESLESRRGFPFHDSSVKIEFVGLKQLIVNSYRDRKGRDKMRLTFEYSGTRQVTLAVGELVRDALPELLQIINERGIPIIR